MLSISERSCGYSAPALRSCRREIYAATKTWRQRPAAKKAARTAGRFDADDGRDFHVIWYTPNGAPQAGIDYGKLCPAHFH